MAGFAACSSSESPAVEQPTETAGRLHVEAPDGAPLRVLFAGDSLTGSYYATTEALGYRPLVVDALGKRGEVEPVGVGVPHGRLSEVEAGTEIPAGAQLALLEVGTNDFGKTPIRTFTDQYASLLDRVSASSPGVAFLCLGIWRGSDDAVNGVNGATYDAAIKSECEERGGHFLPLQPIYDTEGTRGPSGRDTWLGAADEFHPNDKGHALIAEAVLDALRL
jgi:acyl-CoA thioesterase-1